MTGDEMAEKDDLFQDKDGNGPQDPDAEKSSSDVDDDSIDKDEIIDLLNSVDTPDLEEDVIELAETVELESDDADIVDLTEMAEPDDVLELTEEADLPEKEDQTIDLMATSEDFQPEHESEADVLELSDVIKTLPPEDKNVLDLTQEVRDSDEDEIVDLTDAVGAEPSEDEDGIVELTEVADEPADDEAILELTDEADVSEYEETIALGDEAPIELTQQADVAAEDEDDLKLTEEAAVAEEDEIVELTDEAEEAAAPAATDFAETIELDQSTLGDLTQAVKTSPEDEVFALTDEAGDTPAESEAARPKSSVFFETMEMDQSTFDHISQVAEKTEEDEILDLTDETESALAEAAPVVDDAAAPLATAYEETINLDQQEFADAIPQDDMIVDNDEAGKSEEPDEETETPVDYEDTIAMDPTAIPDSSTVDDQKADEEVVEPETPLPKPYEEDKELLELIDDIQATLDTEPQNVDTDEEVPVFEEEAAVVSDDSLENDAQPYELMDDDAVFADPDLPDSESELYDNLGIDLTSEIERNVFEEAQEAAIEDVQPPEDADVTQEEKPVPSDSVKSALKEALSDMLAEEDNPLTKAIEKAVRKAMKQG